MYYPSGNKAHRAQSLLEYSVFLSVVISALLLWQFMIKRSYEGRIKQEIDSVGSSYSPGHTVSISNISTETETHTYIGGRISGTENLVASGAQGRAIDNGVTVSLSTSKTTFDKSDSIDSIRAED